MNKNSESVYTLFMAVAAHALISEMEKEERNETLDGVRGGARIALAADTLATELMRRHNERMKP